jgi:hypothetical protein
VGTIDGGKEGRWGGRPGCVFALTGSLGCLEHSAFSGSHVIQYGAGLFQLLELMNAQVTMAQAGISPCFLPMSEAVQLMGTVA